MKDKCLDDFYKSLEDELNNPEYVNSLKELIQKKELTKESLSRIITEKVK